MSRATEGEEEKLGRGRKSEGQEGKGRDRMDLPKLVIALLGKHCGRYSKGLHTGTESVVRVDGEVGRSFTVKTGVRQGCTYALQPFCRPCCARGPLTAAPDKQFGVQIATNSGGALSTDLTSCIVALMYADHLALLADSPDDLVVLLGMVDALASKYGLFINASKTEIMVIGRPMTLPTFKLSGKELLVTDSFKYLGSFFADDE
eukprot:365242-Chlamydomonas_euryale.AAC.7